MGRRVCGVIWPWSLASGTKGTGGGRGGNCVTRARNNNCYRKKKEEKPTLFARRTPFIPRARFVRSFVRACLARWRASRCVVSRRSFSLRSQRSCRAVETGASERAGEEERSRRRRGNDEKRRARTEETETTKCGVRERQRVEIIFI